LAKNGVIGYALVNKSAARYFNNFFNCPLELLQNFTVLKRLMLKAFKFAAYLTNADKLSNELRTFMMLILDSRFTPPPPSPTS
jgi:hypothetical protein